MDRFADVDIFTDPSLIDDPHPYFEYLRKQGGAVRLPNHGVVAVVGYDEILSVMRDDENFSAVNSVSGPSPPLPFTPEGDDITPQIEQHRGKMPFAGLIATQDPPVHTRTRSLMMGLITPKRLKENEEFMWRLADQQIDKIINQGTINLAKDYGQPFTTLVIADLLGVPEADHKKFADQLGSAPGAPGQLSGNDMAAHNPLEAIGKRIFGYVVKRRLLNLPLALMVKRFSGILAGRDQTARDDMMTELALTKYPDGSTPPVIDVVGVATFLFAAGQDTTAHLITAALRFLAEDPELQARLRNERNLIPNFLEEVLRLEGTVKAMFRLVTKPVRVGDLELAPGTTVMLILAAANRDPKRFDRPGEIVVDRKNARENVSFSRGIHACPGSPLARAEAKVTLERFFDRTADIRINEAIHGPREARRYDFLPTYMFRGVKELHLDITPAA